MGDRVVVEGLQKVRPGVKVNAQTVLIEEKKEEGTDGKGTNGGEGGGKPTVPAHAGEAKTE